MIGRPPERPCKSPSRIIPRRAAGSHRLRDCRVDAKLFRAPREQERLLGASSELHDDDATLELFLANPRLAGRPVCVDGQLDPGALRFLLAPLGFFAPTNLLDDKGRYHAWCLDESPRLVTVRLSKLRATGDLDPTPRSLPPVTRQQGTTVLPTDIMPTEVCTHWKGSWLSSSARPSLVGNPDQSRVRTHPPGHADGRGAGSPADSPGVASRSIASEGVASQGVATRGDGHASAFFLPASVSLLASIPRFRLMPTCSDAVAAGATEVRMAGVISCVEDAASRPFPII